MVTASGCAPSSSSTAITITATPLATFSYTGSPYCSNAGNALPTLGAGSTAGTFTANGGLPVNSVTGEVDLTSALPGTYTVTNSIAAFGGCPLIVATTQIVINALQDPSFTYAGSPYCTVGTVNPTNIVTGGGTFSSTTGLTISASGTINLATSTPGTYIITYVTPGPCVATGTQQIVVNASPNVTVTSDTICLGQTATLTASGATYYTWIGATPLLYNTATATPVSSIIITVTGTTLGCNASDTAYITVNPVPAPIITQIFGNTLQSSGASTDIYEWYWDSILDVSHTTQSFTINSTQNGYWYVIVTNSLGCSSTSAVFQSSVGIDELTNSNSVIISPNPFSFQTTITFAEEQKNTTIEIMDVIGKEIKTINFTGKQCVIEKGEMERGIYFVNITDEKKKIINKKIVIQ